MDAKLMTARAEIEAVLKKHDIAAWVILHNAPGELEIFPRLDPSYSILRPIYGESGEMVQVAIRSKLEEYGGNVAKQVADMGATANMIAGFATVMGSTALQLLDLSQTIDKATGAEHEPLKSTTGRRQ